MTAVVSDGVLRLSWPLAQPTAATKLPSTSNAGSSLLFSDPVPAQHVATAEPGPGMVRRRSSGESSSASSTVEEPPQRSTSAKMEEDS